MVTVLPPVPSLAKGGMKDGVLAKDGVKDGMQDGVLAKDGAPHGMEKDGVKIGVPGTGLASACRQDNSW